MHDLDTELTIVAVGSGDCSGISVFLALTGPVDQGKWEGVAPFSLFGDSNGNHEGGLLDEGTYEISAFPYGLPDSSGLTHTFTLQDV